MTLRPPPGDGNRMAEVRAFPAVIRMDAGSQAPALVQQLFQRHLISDLTTGAEK
jgi:hypothetical protein